MYSARDNRELASRYDEWAEDSLAGSLEEDSL